MCFVSTQYKLFRSLCSVLYYFNERVHPSKSAFAAVREEL